MTEEKIKSVLSSIAECDTLNEFIWECIEEEMKLHGATDKDLENIMDRVRYETKIELDAP